MDKCIESLSKAQAFSTFDANSGYREIETNDEGDSKTPFAMQQGLFCYTKMTFRLKKVLAKFRATEDVF